MSEYIRTVIGAGIEMIVGIQSPSPLWAGPEP